MNFKHFFIWVLACDWLLRECKQIKTVRFKSSCAKQNNPSRHRRPHQNPGSLRQLLFRHLIICRSIWEFAPLHYNNNWVLHHERSITFIISVNSMITGLSKLQGSHQSEINKLASVNLLHLYWCTCRPMSKKYISGQKCKTL